MKNYDHVPAEPPHDSLDAAVDRVGKVVPDALKEFLAAQLHWCPGRLPSVVVDAAVPVGTGRSARFAGPVRRRVTVVRQVAGAGLPDGQKELPAPTPGPYAPRAGIHP
ncbi:hypothetical protein [Streptomyces sp. NPDC096153]|uniref:hypothetical protein n=1 Tax=Streptomyces sp. NPDC096153 TaxID=3155548 RepID=UPI00332E0B5C